MSKHTPGPLIVLEGEEGWIIDTPHERPGADGALAYVSQHGDALLYAAAPDLYDIAELILLILDEGIPLDRERVSQEENICEKLRAAVRKARGKDNHD